MERNVTTASITAVLGLTGLLAFQCAGAAPPLSRSLQPQNQQQNAGQTLGQNLAAHLDLRAPSHAIESSANSAAAFPSMLHRQTLGPQEAAQLPVLGSAAAHPRAPLQEYVSKFHSEGLPVARLFENKSSLIHLGLNQKGKPGLWLIQKIH
jgi:hypothetical protein